MPLLDHFRPPIRRRLPWQTMHTAWLSELAARLNAILPAGYVALDTVQVGGHLELDVGTYEEHGPDGLPAPGGNGVAVAPAVWTPPAATGMFNAVFPDVFEIRVFDPDAAGTLVAAVEFVSPSNKDRPAERQAFAAKCAAYLAGGASLVVIDVISVLRANLHTEIVRLLQAPAELERPVGGLYAAAYRPVRHGEESSVEVWTADVVVGDTLPTMPLYLGGERVVPVEFEATYTEACRRRRFTT